MSEADLARISLGDELLRLRESARRTQEEVGEKLWISGTTVHRIEQGKTSIRGPQLETLLDFLGVRDEATTTRLLGLAGRGRQRHSAYDQYRDIFSIEALNYFSWEALATRIRDLQLVFVPGILQTPAYTRHLITDVQGIHDDVDRFLASRQERWDRTLGRDDPPEMRFVIDEAVLYRPFGGRDEMAAQLDHLREVARLPGVTIDVVPLGEGASPALRSSFTLLEFDRRHHYADVLFIEGPRGDTNVLEPAATKARGDVWDLVTERHVSRKPLDYYLKRALDTY
jgi:transcriptional regulator with XRE-family HTH domain